MHTVNAIGALRGLIGAWRASGARIAFVPTMGNLHAGHARLLEVARTRAERVIASIFVNPLQFSAGEDYQSYPRTVEHDCALLNEAGVDALFLPAVSLMYPQGLEQSVQVVIPALADILCGAHRPGHFQGVATVVAKLFNIVQPDCGVFGEKDYQQLLVIRRLVQDLNFPLDIISVPTVRAADGLALSSRNAYLTPEQRASAPLLYQTLTAVCVRVEQGDRDFARLEAEACGRLCAAGLVAEYVSVRRADDLAPPQREDRDLIVVAAARLGATRLIDNRRLVRTLL